MIWLKGFFFCLYPLKNSIFFYFYLSTSSGQLNKDPPPFFRFNCNILRKSNVKSNVTKAKIWTKNICCYSVIMVNIQLTRSRTIFFFNFQNSKPKHLLKQAKTWGRQEWHEGSEKYLGEQEFLNAETERRLN